MHALLPNAGSPSSTKYIYIRALLGWELIAHVEPRGTRTDGAARKFIYSESQRTQKNNAGTGADLEPHVTA